MDDKVKVNLKEIGLDGSGEGKSSVVKTSLNI